MTAPDTSCAWNRCPKCGQLVDVDDGFDGSEVRCLACNAHLVWTAFMDDTWALVPATDDDEADDDGGDP